MEKLRFIRIAFAAMLLAIFPMMNMQAAVSKLSPTATVKEANAAISGAAKNAKSKSEAISKIKDVLEKYCDFTTMAKQVTGSFSTQLSGEQMKKFNSTFIELLKASNASKLKGISSADKLVYSGEKIDGSTATVKSIAKTADKSAKVDYIMRLENGKWLVVNYVVEDINTVDNYKKQFKRLFKQNSFDKVMSNLEKRTANFNSGK